MSDSAIREQLHQQIDELPDEVVEQIADFTLFVIARKRFTLDFADWERKEWQAFALGQLCSSEEAGAEVDYALEDAQEVFHP